jgi:hypothetical protein
MQSFLFGFFMFQMNILTAQSINHLKLIPYEIGTKYDTIFKSYTENYGDYKLVDLKDASQFILKNQKDSAVYTYNMVFHNNRLVKINVFFNVNGFDVIFKTIRKQLGENFVKSWISSKNDFIKYEWKDNNRLIILLTDEFYQGGKLSIVDEIY